MARIRTIKPEFWKDELVGSWPMASRLAYIAIWNEADDEGRLRAHAVYLRSVIFPYEPSIDMAEVLRPLVESGRLVVYQADGQTYGWIPKFTSHQAISKPSRSRLPAPPKTIPGVLPEPSRSIPGALPEPSRWEGKGRERKGKEEEPSGADAPAPPLTKKTRAKKQRDPSPDTLAVRDEIETLSGVAYPPATLDALDERLAAGELSRDDALVLVRGLARDEFWGGKLRLHPAKLFRNSNWPGLLAQVKATRKPLAASDTYQRVTLEDL